ncbi:hypothetical protein Tco_0432060 [Tanacetum coccineum]
MIKYSFRQDEEYVAVKENEYEDLTSTSEDACQAYQEIFRMIDEGWMVVSLYGVFQFMDTAFRGLDVCVDLTGSSPLTQTGLTDFLAGHAMVDAAHRKRLKYKTKKIRHICACTSQKTTKENKINTPYSENPIRRIQAMEIKYSGTYRTWSLLQETPNTSYRSLSMRRSGHTLTLLEFSRRLGLYHADEINDEGFKKMITYGVCQRTTGYDKMQRNKLWLMSMFEVKHQNGYVNVAWLMAKWLKRKESEAKEIELISPDGRLIAEDPVLGVPRVAMPKGLHPSMQDLYDKMGNIDIRQGTLERMARRQSYHTNRYAGLFEHMAGQYGYTLHEAYAPPGYDEEQQDDEE